MPSQVSDLWDDEKLFPLTPAAQLNAGSQNTATAPVTDVWDDEKLFPLTPSSQLMAPPPLRPVRGADSFSMDAGPTRAPTEGEIGWSRTLPGGLNPSPVSGMGPRAAAPISPNSPDAMAGMGSRGSIAGNFGPDRIADTVRSLPIGVFHGVPRTIKEGATLGLALESAVRNPFITAIDMVGQGLDGAMDLGMGDPVLRAAGVRPGRILADKAKNALGLTPRPPTPTEQADIDTLNRIRAAATGVQAITRAAAPPRSQEFGTPENLAFSAGDSSIGSAVPALGAIGGGAVAGPPGAILGAFGPSMLLQTGSNVEQITQALTEANAKLPLALQVSEDEIRRRALGPGTAAGTASAAIESIAGPESLRIARGIDRAVQAIPKSGGFVKRIAGATPEILQGGVEEGLTEPLQGGISAGAQRSATNNLAGKAQPITEEDVRNFFKARGQEAILGTALGLGFGTARAVGAATVEAGGTAANTIMEEKKRNKQEKAVRDYLTQQGVSEEGINMVIQLRRQGVPRPPKQTPTPQPPPQAPTQTPPPSPTPPVSSATTPISQTPPTSVPPPSQPPATPTTPAAIPTPETETPNPVPNTPAPAATTPPPTSPAPVIPPPVKRPKPGEEFPERPAMKGTAVQGRKGKLILADETEREVVYTVLDIEDLIPTHDPTKGFAINPYGDSNERAYEDPTEGADGRKRTTQTAENLEPGLVLTNTPTATDGPPITSETYRVLGGNLRSMAIIMAYANAENGGNGESAKKYREELIRDAQSFGVDPDEVRAKPRPILVRVIQGDVGKRGSMSRVLNDALTAGKSKTVDAVSRGLRLEQSQTDTIAGLLGDEGDSIRSILSDGKRASVVTQVMVEAGAFSASDVVRFRNEDGTLNDEGKNAIEQALLGAAVGDVRTMAQTSAATTQKLMRALSSITRLRRSKTTGGEEGADGGLDFQSVMGNALDALFSLRESKARSISDLVSQSSMLPEPWRKDARAVALAASLLDDTGKGFAAKLKDVAAIADITGGGQGGFDFGQPKTPLDAFDSIFNTAKYAEMLGETGGINAMPKDLFGREVIEPFGNTQKELGLDFGRSNPDARRPGETDLEYRIRIKFKEAEKNTQSLFGGAAPASSPTQPTTPPSTPKRKFGKKGLSGMPLEREDSDPSPGRAIIITGNEFQGSTPKEVRTNAREFAMKELRDKAYVNEATGKTIRISRASINKIIANTGNITRAHAIQHIPEIIRKGVPVDSQLPLDANSADKAWHYFAVDVTLGGNPARIRFTVREDVEGNWYYNHDIDVGTQEDPPENQVLQTPPKGPVNLPAVGGSQPDDSTTGLNRFPVEEQEIVSSTGRTVKAAPGGRGGKRGFGKKTSPATPAVVTNPPAPLTLEQEDLQAIAMALTGGKKRLAGKYVKPKLSVVTPKTPAQRQIAAVLTKLGVEPRFIDIEGVTGADAIEGILVARNGNRVYISTSVKDADLGAMALHEIMHSLRRRDRGAWTFVKNALGQDAIKKASDDYRRIISGTLGEDSPFAKAFDSDTALQEDEGVSRAIEMLASDPQIARKLDQGGIFTRLRAAISRIIDALGLGGQKAKVRREVLKALSALEQQAARAAGKPKPLSAKAPTDVQFRLRDPGRYGKDRVGPEVQTRAQSNTDRPGKVAQGRRDALILRREFRRAKREGRMVANLPQQLVSHRGIIEQMASALNLAAPLKNQKSMMGRALGYFTVNTTAIRLNSPDNTTTYFHEVGHYLNQLLFPGYERAALDEYLFPVHWRQELIDGGKRLYGPREPQNGYASEGYAELTRGILLDPQKTAKLYPNAYREMTQRLASEFPEVWAVLKRGRAQFAALKANPNPVRAYLYNPKIRKFMARISDHIASLRIALLDRYSRLRDFEIDIEQTGGKKLETLRSPHQRALRARGKANGHVQLVVEHGIWDLDQPVNPDGTFNIIGPSIDEVVDLIGNSLAKEEWNEYMIAKRAVEKRAQGFGGTLGKITDDELAAFIDKSEKDHPEWVEAAAKFQQINEWLIGEYMVHHGMLSEDAAKKIIDANKNYIPFRSARKVNDRRRYGLGGGKPKGAGKFGNVASPISRFVGGRDELVDPLGAFLYNLNSFMVSAQNNSIAQSVAALAQSPGAARWIEKVDAPTERLYVRQWQFKRQVNEQLGPTVAINPFTGPTDPMQRYMQDEWESMLEDLHGFMAFNEANKPVHGRPGLMAVRNGDKHTFYHVHDEMMWKTLVGQTEPTPPNNIVSQTIAGAATLLRMGATQRNLGFLIPNFARDFVQAMTMTEAERRSLPQDTVRRLKAIKNAYDNKDVERMFLVAGGSMNPSYVSSLIDSETQEANSTRLFAKPTLLGKFKQAITSPKDLDNLKGLAKDVLLLEAVERASDSIERINRLMEFESIREGKTDKATLARAAQGAADITIDFSRGGTFIKSMNQYIPFLNAAVQGTNKLFRFMAEHPLRAVKGIILFSVSPSIVSLLMNRDNEDYWAKSQNSRDRFWYFPLSKEPGKETYLRYPKPPGLGVFSNTIERAYASVFGFDSTTGKKGGDPRAWKNYGDSVAAGLTPNVSLAFFEPLMAVSANYDFFRDAPIVNRRDQALPPSEQGAERASKTARLVGRVLNQPPAHVDYLITAYLAGLGDKVTRYVADPIVSVVAPEPRSYPQQPPPRLDDLPIIKSFLATTTGSQHESLRRFYDDFDEARAVYTQLNKLKADPEGYEAYAQLHAKDLRTYQTLNRTNTRINEIMRAWRAVHTNRTMNGDELTARSRELITTAVQLAREAQIERLKVEAEAKGP